MPFSALRGSLILCTVLASTASAQIVGPNADSIPSEWVSHPYFTRFDEAARAARLAPLRETPLHAGQREVRIWTQPDNTELKHLYRFTERDGRVHGDLIEVWNTSPPDTSLRERPGETTHDLMVYERRGHCDGFARTSEMGSCHVRFQRAPRWTAVLRDAVSHGLWALPDPSTLPPDRVFALGGWTMVVELRDGVRYRTYRYHNPDTHPSWPSAAQANEIAVLLSAVDSLARRPDVVKTYRGITTGRYGSVFRSCDGAEWEFRDELRSLAERSPHKDRVHVNAFPNIVELEPPLYQIEVLGELTPEWLARRWGSKYPRALQVLELRAAFLLPRAGTPAARPPSDPCFR